MNGGRRIKAMAMAVLESKILMPGRSTGLLENANSLTSNKETFSNSKEARLNSASVQNNHKGNVWLNLSASSRRENFRFLRLVESRKRSVRNGDGRTCPVFRSDRKQSDQCVPNASREQLNARLRRCRRPDSSNSRCE